MYPYIPFCWITIIFFIIGITCYFNSCNPDYASECYTYNIIDGTSYGYQIQNKTCDKCVDSSVKGGCSEYFYFNCYDTNILYNYGNNKTCYYALVSETTNLNYANRVGKNYPIGEEKKLLKYENSEDCVDIKIGMDIWIVAIVFLSLTTSCIICCCVAGFIEMKTKNNYIEQ